MEERDLIKRTKEARMDLARKRPAVGADKTRIFWDNYKAGNTGHFLQNKSLYFHLLPQIKHTSNGL